MYEGLFIPDRFLLNPLILPVTETMSNRRYGPGSDPTLHQNVDTYCRPPVVTAQFIPESKDTYPPLRIYLLISEVKDYVYGQVFCEWLFREFEDLPHVGPGAYPRTKRLEFESEEGIDPLVVLWKTLTGLRETTNRLQNINPILKSVTILSRDYVELGVDLMKEYGTPLVTLQGYISRDDIVSIGDKDNDERIDVDHSLVPL